LGFTGSGAGAGFGFSFVVLTFGGGSDFILGLLSIASAGVVIIHAAAIKVIAAASAFMAVSSVLVGMMKVSLSSRA
jgi:hypothetical protein